MKLRHIIPFIGLLAVTPVLKNCDANAPAVAQNPGTTVVPEPEKPIVPVTPVNPDDKDKPTPPAPINPDDKEKLGPTPGGVVDGHDIDACRVRTAEAHRTVMSEINALCGPDCKDLLPHRRTVELAFHNTAMTSAMKEGSDNGKGTAFHPGNGGNPYLETWSDVGGMEFCFSSQNLEAGQKAARDRIAVIHPNTSTTTMGLGD